MAETFPDIRIDDEDDDLDLNPDDEPVEVTREQELSRMPLRQLQQLAKANGLSGAGRTHELISRIVSFEETGIIPEGEPLELKAGNAPSPTEPTAAELSAALNQRAPTTNTAPGPVGVSAAPAGPGKKAPQKTGFFPDLNVYRAEFPLGPRGTIDDTTHFQFIEDSHGAARRDGYRTLGYPNAGRRVGRSTMMINGAPMATVVYEVYAREE